MAKKTSSNKIDSKNTSVENAKQRLDELHGFLDQIMNSACAKQISDLKFALALKDEELKKKDQEIATLQKRIQKLTSGLTGGYYYPPDENKSKETKIKEDINDIFQRCGDRDGFIDYHRMSDLRNSLITYLDQIADMLLNESKEEILFEISVYAFKIWGETDMDDDGDTESIADEIQCILQQIVERDSQNFTPIMVLNALIKYTDEFRGCGLDKYIEDMLIAVFKTKEANQIKLNYFKQRLIECGGSYAPSYMSSYYAHNCLSIMDDLEIPIEELKQYCAEFKDHCLDRELAEIEYKRGNIKESIIYYQKQVELNHRNIVAYERLLELLIEIGDYERCIKVFCSYLSYNPANITKYNEYKSMFIPERWESEFQVLLANVKANGLPVPINWLAEEKRFDMVMNEIENQKSIYSIKRYSKELKTLYPERCLKLLKEHAQQMAENSNNRHHYQELASFMKFMKEFNGGSEIVTAMINEYRIIYKRRSAMMDELNKI